MAKPERFERRQTESARALGEVCQRMAGGIAIRGRIVRGSDSQALDHKQNHAFDHGRTITDGGRAANRLMSEAITGEVTRASAAGMIVSGGQFLFRDGQQKIVQPLL